MTTTIYFGSKNDMIITNDQLQRILDRFKLGKLISSAITAHGVMGQTRFVTSSEGEYVLKTKPIYEGQFIEEKYVVDNLQRKTKVPVPDIYLVDSSADILGTGYSIMTRLPGEHISSDSFRNKVQGTADEEKVAEILAGSLIQMHGWENEPFGEFDPVNHEIRPFKESYKGWLFNAIKYWLEDAKNYSSISDEDMLWVERIMRDSEEAFDALSYATFVMGDFKPENVLVQSCAPHSWRVSGVFDFTNSYFGDPIADLSKLTAWYMDQGKEELAQKFVTAYFAGSNSSYAKDHFIKRLKVHMLYERILFWGGSKATNRATWAQDLSFADWAGKYTEAGTRFLV